MENREKSDLSSSTHFPLLPDPPRCVCIHMYTHIEMLYLGLCIKCYVVIVMVNLDCQRDWTVEYLGGGKRALGL